MPLRRNQSPPNPVSLNTQVMARVVTPLGLEPDEARLAGVELEWLFSAVEHFLQIYQTVQQQLDAENRRLIKKYAGDVLSSRKRERELADIEPRLWQDAINQSPPIAAPIPPGAEMSPPANNRLPANLDSFSLEQWGKQIDGKLKLMADHFRNLNLLEEREALQGAAGKQNTALQNQLRLEKLSILKTLHELAEILEQSYGIFVSGPARLYERVEQQGW